MYVCMYVYVICHVLLYFLKNIQHTSVVPATTCTPVLTYTTYHRSHPSKFIIFIF